MWVEDNYVSFENYRNQTQASKFQIKIKIFKGFQMISETYGKEINHPETFWNHMFHNLTHIYLLYLKSYEL